jgi:hypothetical protein
MFEVIFSHDVDVTPKQAREATDLARRAPGGAAGGMEIGVEPCAEITVGFIWPCGTLRIGGCGTILSAEMARTAQLVGGGEAPRSMTLHPQKDEALIRKMALMGVEHSEGKKFEGKK